MSGFFRRLIGSISVYEEKDLVHVVGVYTPPIMEAFYKVWNTSRIENYMFTHLDNSSFTLNKFFVPDLVYSLSSIIEHEVKDVNIRAISKIVELLKMNTWFKVAYEPTKPIFHRENLNRFVFKPLPHQVEFFDACEINMQKLHLHGYLLAAAAGSGKTFLGLATGELIESDVNIFIVPKNSVDLVWKKSFETLYKKPISYWTTSSSEDPKWGCRNYAFHYERIDQAIEFVKKHKFKNPLLWLDESHNLNEMTSLRSQLFLELSSVLKPTCVIWASGTPIKAMGKEVIPLLKSIDPYFNKDAEERFINIFGKSSTRATDILNNRMLMLMHKTAKAEFRGVKPISKDIKVRIPNGSDYTLTTVREVIKAFVIERTDYYAEHKKSYELKYNIGLNEFEETLKSKEQKLELAKYKGYIKTISKGYDPKVHKEIARFCNHYELKVISPILPKDVKEAFRDARTVVKYVNLRILGEALGRVLSQLRERCITDMVPYAKLDTFIDEAEKKVVIFSTFVKAILAADKHLHKEGYKPLLVYGETNKDLSAIVGRFDKDENINPLLATFASLSTAVPLTMANVAIMLNTPFRPYVLEQAIARVDRIGQNSQVYVYNLYLDTGDESNLSTRAGDILQFCKEQVEQILGTPLTLEEGESVSIECYDNNEFHYPHLKPIQTTWDQW